MMRDPRYCPHCEADLRGEPIPDKYFEHDRTSQRHLDSVESHKRWNLPGECTCLPYGDRPPEDRFYSQIIGIEIRGVYDGILYWMCPYCEGRWHRFPEGDRLHALAEPYVRGELQPT